MTTMWWAVSSCLGMLCGDGGPWLVPAFVLAASCGLLFNATTAPCGAGGRRIAAARWRRATATAAVSAILCLSGATLPRPGEAWPERNRPFLLRAIEEEAGRRCDRGPLSNEARAFLRALLLADRGLLGTETIERYRYLGISHLLALSGLHLGVVLAGCGAVLAAAGMPRRRRAPAAIAMSATYGAAAGFPPSLVRALLLGGAALARRIAGRTPSLECSLWLCLLSAAFLFPRTLATVSFALSLAAVASIVYIALPLVDRLGLRHGGGGRRPFRIVAGALVFSAAVTAGLVPVTTGIFGRAPIAAPVVTCLAIIPVTLYLYIGMVYMIITSRLLPVVAVFLEPIAKLMGTGAEKLATLPCPAIYRGGFSLPAYVSGVLLLACGLNGRDRRALVAPAAGLIAVSLLCGGPRGPAGPEVTRIAGRATVVEDGGRILVVDRSFREEDAGRIVRAAWRRGIGTVDLLVAIGGDKRALDAACRIASRIRVRRTILGPYALAVDGETPRGGVDCPGEETIVDVGAMRAIVGAPAFPPPAGRPVGARETLLAVEIVSLRDGERLYRYPR